MSDIYRIIVATEEGSPLFVNLKVAADCAKSALIQATAMVDLGVRENIETRRVASTEEIIKKAGK